jgi:monoamine oxidase
MGPDPTTDFDVVIVGGGAAGIGAARRLAASGLSALLLEAGSRLGGRGWTHEIAGLELDLGCGWLHSAEKNAWAGIAKAAGIPLHRGPAAWGTQFRDLGFSAAERSAARQAFDAWTQRLASVAGASDRAADALDANGPWNSYIQAVVGFISGGRLEQMSAADYLAYDEASTESNWRSLNGYGALIAGNFPAGIRLRLATPVESIELDVARVRMTTPAGTIRARAVIMTVSTAVLTGDTIKLPAALNDWREAASNLPLGRDEKFFLEITGDAPFENETQVLGNPRDPHTASYYIRPLGRPVIECYFGGEGARAVEDSGTAAGFALALDQLSALFGADIRGKLRPLIASAWSRSIRVGGAYSYALPRQAGARQRLSRSFEQKVFFAGEATCVDEFSTAHGAYDSGVRAADEVMSALGPVRVDA